MNASVSYSYFTNKLRRNALVRVDYRLTGGLTGAGVVGEAGKTVSWYVGGASSFE
jgi:hypothetical protein